MVFLGKEEEQSEDRYLVVVYKIHEKSTINRCQLIETIVSREEIKNSVDKD